MEPITVTVEETTLSWRPGQLLEKLLQENPKIARVVKPHLETSMKFFTLNINLLIGAALNDPVNTSPLVAFIETLHEFSTSINTRTLV